MDLLCPHSSAGGSHPSSSSESPGAARTTTRIKDGRFSQVTSRRTGCWQEAGEHRAVHRVPGREEDGVEEEEEEEGRRPCAGARGCLALGRVSLAAASSGRSPYLSEDFVTMATLMSSALWRRAALTSSATFFFPFFSFLFPFWGFLFI